MNKNAQWACLVEGFNTSVSAGVLNLLYKRVDPGCWLRSGFESPRRQPCCKPLSGSYQLWTLHWSDITCALLGSRANKIKIKIHPFISAPPKAQNLAWWPLFFIAYLFRFSIGQISNKTNNNKHSENADTSTSVSFDLVVWHWPFIKVKKADVIRCRLLYCTLIPGMMSMGLLLYVISPFVYFIWPSTVTFSFC